MAVDAPKRQVGDIPEAALVRGAMDLGRDDLGELTALATYAPAGTAPLGGDYYRVVDTGVRCVRAPCFSYRAAQVNGSTRTSISGVDLGASGARAVELSRAEAALTVKDGLYASGRVRPSGDGGRVFRATRLFLREPLPRA